MRSMNRLFSIVLLLRRGKVITARQIASDLEVSQRTVYRDLKNLMEQGIPIEGEPGVGYSLRKEFYLPPLMFTDSELKALAAGAQMIHGAGDSAMAKAANYALAKIEASLPQHLKSSLEAPRLALVSSMAKSA
ncbi:MAG TPA: HTH domain-containing protein [Candidatus Solibacter sp.]|nr:HTH domain-containing protein [Candidatus Solibacter sp.]